MLQVVPLQEIEEERVRMVSIETAWGIFCCLATSRRGGWVALSKQVSESMVKVVELGKAT